MNKKQWLIVGLSLFVLLMIGGTAGAAERISADEEYRLAAGERVDDDLYIRATSIYIEGTVEGDLLAFANYVEISGTVTGDVLVLAGGVSIPGEVEGDVRVIAAGVEVSGTVGEDLLVLAGGGQGLDTPIALTSGPTVQQGLHVNGNAVVGGDIVAWVSTAEVAGTIEEDLDVRGDGQRNVVSFSGRVAGDADIEAAVFEVSDEGQVEGELFYRAPERIELPAGMDEEVTYRPLSTNNNDQLVQRLLRMVAAMTGFAILGWLILSYAPRLITVPVSYVQAQPGTTIFVGFLVALSSTFVTAILMFGVALFWGVIPAVLLGLAVVSGLVLLWVFSPLITGLWIGQRFSSQPLTALIIGAVTLTLLFQLGLVGVLLAAVSFFAVLGSLVLVLIASQVPAE